MNRLFRWGLAAALLLLVSILPLAAQEVAALEERIAAVPGVVSVKHLGKIGDDATTWLVMFAQPLDHQNPWRGSFHQRMFLIHRSETAPNVMITDGYSVTFNAQYEITKTLSANQLYIEHRFFGNSKPEMLEWKYLKIEQSAHDYHAIREAFATLYTDKWISTGISKGGQTALFYKYFYPQDVTATVAYVAPMALAREDDRVWDFIERQGTDECRERIREFQRQVLKNRDAMLTQLESFQKKFNQDFLLGTDVTLEFIVAEYPFSFWQMYQGFCETIPGENATAEEMFQHLNSVVPLYLYTKQTYPGLAPAFYQFVTEIGYYGFDVEHLGDLIKYADRLDNRYFAPEGVELKYDGRLVQAIHQWLRHKAQNVIYVYGGIDTWSACAVEPQASTNSFAVYAKEGNHATRISTLSEEDQQRVYDTLTGWLAGNGNSIIPDRK